MHPWLVRHVVSPSLERLLGRHTFACLRELEASQWWDEGRLRELQARKLRELLDSAATHCPYYHRILGRPRASDDPFETLWRLPLLDKAAIRTHLDDMTNRTVPGGPIPFNTGGSTGEPLTFHVDRRRIAYDKAARMLTHAWFGAVPGDREVYLWGSPVELRGRDRVRRVRDWLTNETLLEAFNLSPESMNRYLARMHALDPVSVFGYPSSLATFAEHCRFAGGQLESRSLKAVFVTGEWLNPRQRDVIAGFFSVPVANCYGSRDGGFIAHECPHGGMHVFDQNVIVEILDAAGRPVGCDHVGEIVLTHLDAYAMPLIRYRTGDMGALSSKRCRCGRRMRLLGAIEGRRTDHLVGEDGRLQHGLSAIYCVREMRTVRQFQIHQRADRSVDVMIVPERGFDARAAAEIETLLKQRLGAGIAVRVHAVDSIVCANSGKFRQVISDAHRTNAESLACAV